MKNSSDNGFLEGNGIIILILFFLMFGGFGGGWGNTATQEALTRAELYDGLNSQNTFSEFRSIGNQINNGFANTTQSLNNGFANTALALNNGFNSVQSAIADTNYRMQSCCCELKNAIHSEGEETRALIQDNTIQALRDTVADKDRELLATGLVTAQTLQTNNLENFIRQLMNGGCSCS